MGADTLSVEDNLRLQAALLQAVKMAVVATRPDGEILYWNPFAEQLYGWTADEVLGRNIVEMMVPPSGMQSAAEIMSLLRKGESWSGEFTVKRKDGAYFTASVTDSPIFDQAGSLIGLVGVSHDLTPVDQARVELERQVAQRTAELEAANQNLRDLSARLIQLRDEECRRIARDLHDSVGQLLAAIGMNIGVIKRQSHALDEAGARAVSENEILVAEISREIRTISHLLHPPLLDELGLVSALHSYVDGYSARSKIHVDLIIPPDFGRLTDDIEIACFRIVQECLTNIHRHSKSSAAAITMRHGDGRVLVEVSDGGIGMPRHRLAELTSSGGSGVGLAGMQERVRQLGGTLEIHSGAGGTTVMASLPLKQSPVVA